MIFNKKELRVFIHLESSVSKFTVYYNGQFYSNIHHSRYLPMIFFKSKMS